MKTIEDKRTGREFKPMGSCGSLETAVKMIKEKWYISADLTATECGAYGQKKLYQVATSTKTLDIKIMNRGNRYLIGWEA